MTKHQIAAFKYAPLRHNEREIRLVNLLPGQFNSDIRIQIIHRPLLETRPPSRQFSKSSEIKNLQDALPAGWIVKRTIEERFLFISRTTGVTSWDPPSHFIPTSVDSTELEDMPDKPCPKYEAVSYTWGQSGGAKPVYVVPEGREVSEEVMTLKIRTNLSSALRHLRHTDRSRTLWIDALCINQDDLQERDSQIKRMGDIYNASTAVMIWLGEPSGSSALALEKLNYLGLQVEHTRDRWYPSPDATDPGLGDPQMPLPFNDEVWDAIGDLLSRAWFERVWVQQEARNARSGKVYCGSDNIPWTVFRRAVLTLREKCSLPKRLIGIVEDAREVCNSRYLNDFFWLMVMSRKQKCSEPRDKIYGVLSLCPSRLRQCIEPQLEKSVAEVYQDAFLVYTAVTGRLDLLSHINHGTSSWESPSWVPDWSQGADNTLQAVCQSAAAGMSKASFEVTPSNTLRVKGVLVGKVLRVDKAVQGESDRLFEIWRHADALGVQCWSGNRSEKLIDAFWDLVLLTCSRERYPTNLSYLSCKDLKKRYFNTPHSLGMLPEIHTASLRNLSFITVSQGLLGLAPTGTAPGDFVCVLLGCHFPIILRTLSSGDGYRIIGPTQTHGISDGEAILGDLPKPWKVEFYRDNMGVSVLHFRNEETGELTTDDPRLEPLSGKWEQIERDRTPHDPRFFVNITHKDTGEYMNSDPRMSEVELERRGVNLRIFEIY
ncbi:heterokaryon incompatibility protein-domain-containing protein [Xylariaceae sp. FL0255]|nr:heterokaryon incompatibility protein-domain-containing protein [Xylariaceae sp. FL0255]